MSRYKFVYPCWTESTETAIEACEVAWEFYDGVFRVVVPDCTKAIVHTADPVKPRIVDDFLEYAQARGFHVDPRASEALRGPPAGRRAAPKPAGLTGRDGTAIAAAAAREGTAEQ